MIEDIPQVLNWLHNQPNAQRLRNRKLENGPNAGSRIFLSYGTPGTSF